MKGLAFSKRNDLEILRDPLNLFFGVGFPIVLLLLLSAIQAHIPVALFEIGRLAPGIAVFGLSFMTLFSATLVARDRGMMSNEAKLRNAPFEVTEAKLYKICSMAY